MWTGMMAERKHGVEVRFSSQTCSHMRCDIAHPSPPARGCAEERRCCSCSARVRTLGRLSSLLSAARSGAIPSARPPAQECAHEDQRNDCDSTTERRSGAMQTRQQPAKRMHAEAAYEQRMSRHMQAMLPLSSFASGGL